MGRGLAAILASAPVSDAGDELREIPVELIDPNPHQPRTTVDEAALAALADSVRARGVLQPVLVRPLAGGRYGLIAGERRWRAAECAGLAEVPAIVRRDTDAMTLELALIENMAREDLNPVDEARACAALVEELSLSREDVGRRVGRSRASVSNLIRLLDLPDEALDLLEVGALTEGHGRALLMAPDYADRRRLAVAAAERDWSVRELEVHARAAGPGGPPPKLVHSPTTLPHPDAEAVASELAESFERAFGTPVRVRTRSDGGLRVELRFARAADALALAERLREEPIGPGRGG